MYYQLGVLTTIIIGLCVRDYHLFLSVIGRWSCYRFNVNHNDHSPSIMTVTRLSKKANHFDMSVDLFICIEHQENTGKIDFNECGQQVSMPFKRRRYTSILF